MITGEKKLSYLQKIRNLISDYDIYKMFYPYKFVVNKRCRSPFRKDDNPSFLIGNKYGDYSHIDFGDGKYRGGAIDFIMQIENVDFSTALQIIDKKFGLGIKSDLKDWKSVVSSYEQPKIKENEREVDIQCTTKIFTADMHKWWNSYHLSEDYLKNKNVFQVKNLYISRKKFPLDSKEIVIAYLNEDGKMKIYRPTCLRKVSKDDQFYIWRFRSNIPFDYMFGKENIKNCKKSLILKSRKDELVSSLILPCVASVQAENIACFNQKNVEFLQKNSEEIYIGFGTDDQGKEQSNLITKTFGWKHYNTEDKYLPLNDIAEVAKQHGLETVEKHMKIKGLL